MLCKGYEKGVTIPQGHLERCPKESGFVLGSGRPHGYQKCSLRVGMGVGIVIVPKGVGQIWIHIGEGRKGADVFKNENVVWIVMCYRERFDGAKS